MDRKEFWVPLAVVGLTALFAVVSLLVRATRGNPWFIRRKLAVGATLLTLTWAASGCSGDDGPGGGGVTCYVPVPPNQFTFDAELFADGRLVVDLDEDAVIEGHVRDRSGEAFAFLLNDPDGEVARGSVAAVDGAFDENTEAISLDLGASLTPGDYEILFYVGAPETITPESGPVDMVFVRVVDPTP